MLEFTCTKKTNKEAAHVSILTQIVQESIVKLLTSPPEIRTQGVIVLLRRLHNVVWCCGLDQRIVLPSLKNPDDV